MNTKLLEELLAVVDVEPLGAHTDGSVRTQGAAG